MSVSWPNPPLERSIFGVDPLDEFSVTVADWIWQHVRGQEHVEIEAKIGTLIDDSTRDRLRLPVLCETIVDIPGVRFESNMAEEQHAHFNKLLNEVVGMTMRPDYKGARITHERQMETDAFFAVPQSKEKEKVRVTTNQKTNTVTSSIIKRRIANLEVYSPRRAFDYRISINTEQPIPVPEGQPPSHVRSKNRVSYAHQTCQVDLTQVEVSEGRERLHELEVEMTDMNGFLSLGEQTRRQGDGQKWTPFEDRVLIFLNSVRMLIRNAAE